MTEPPSGTVTLLFSDIEGSTRLLRRTGDGFPELLARCEEILWKRGKGLAPGHEPEFVRPRY